MIIFSEEESASGNDRLGSCEIHGGVVDPEQYEITFSQCVMGSSAVLLIDYWLFRYRYRSPSDVTPRTEDLYIWNSVFIVGWRFVVNFYARGAENYGETDEMIFLGKIRVSLSHQVLQKIPLPPHRDSFRSMQKGNSPSYDLS